MRHSHKGSRRLQYTSKVRKCVKISYKKKNKLIRERMCLKCLFTAFTIETDCLIVTEILFHNFEAQTVNVLSPA